MALLLPLCALSRARAQSAPAPVALDRVQPVSAGLFYEQIRLPADEQLGLLGKTIMFRATTHTYAGPFVLSAVSGRRGGFFVLGAEGRLVHEGRRVGVAAGLGVGGGGGVAAPVGDGLVWRPSLSVTVPAAGWRVGTFVSAVHFPSGSISSGQVGLSLARADVFRFAPPSRVGRATIMTRRAGLGVDELSLVTSHARFAPSGAPWRTMTLVGARAMRTLGDGRTGTVRAAEWSAGIETYGAARGDAAGYMEVLTVGSVRWPLTEGLFLGGSGALGAGGGGAVPMGSGMLTRVTGHASLALASRLSVRAEFGQYWALGSSLRGTSQTLAVALPLAPSLGDTVRLLRIEWTPAVTHFWRGARTSGASRPMQTVGLSVARFLSPRFLIVAQGHSATGGAAGAYAVGLLGAGASSAHHRRAQVGGAVLAGAAGGGGVATGGGAIVQAEGWTSVRVTESVAVRLAAGVTTSVSGPFASPFVAIGATRAMAMPGAHAP